MKMLKLLAVAIPITLFLGWFISVGGGAAVKLVAFVGFFAFVWSKAAANKRKRLKEMDECRSEGMSSCAMQENDMMPVLVNGLVVYEAKEIASCLEAANVRFRVERSEEDSSFVYGGHGGTGTRMRIRVNRDDFEKAANILKEKVRCE